MFVHGEFLKLSGGKKFEKERKKIAQVFATCFVHFRVLYMTYYWVVLISILELPLKC